MNDSTVLNEEFVCKTVNNVEEVVELIEASFGYTCDFDGSKAFGK